MTDFITTIVIPQPIRTTVAAGQGPAGVGANPARMTATEDMPAGAFVNIFSGGVRLASRDHYSRSCHGFILDNVVQGAPIVVNFAGQNDKFITGGVLGPVYLDLNGGVTESPPSGATLVQQVGIVTGDNIINFVLGIPVVLDGTPL